MCLRRLAACPAGPRRSERIRALQPDAALLDLRMRDLDGLALLEELVSIRSKTRVIFLPAADLPPAARRSPSPPADRPAEVTALVLRREDNSERL